MEISLAMQMSKNSGLYTDHDEYLAEVNQYLYTVLR